MTDEIDLDDLVGNNPKAEIIKYIKELQDWVNWYSMWHKKFKNEIEELKKELETYRPTKITGEGQTRCHKCGDVNWTCFGFYHYKGQTLCDKCLNEILKREKV